MNKSYVRICISLYPDDIERLDKLSKRCGFSRSEFIRFVLIGLMNEEKFIYFKRIFDK